MSVCCGIRQGNFYKCRSKSLQLLDKDFIYMHEFHNLAVPLLMSIKVFLANVPIMKKQVKLSNQLLEDSDEDM